MLLGGLAAFHVHSLLQGRSAAADVERWRVFFDENHPPYNFHDGSRYGGMDLEIVRAVLRRLDVEAEDHPHPWPRVLAALDRGEADLAFQLASNPERFERYLMVGPFRTGQTVLVARKDSSIAYSGMDSLAGLTIGTVRGFSYTPDFDSASGFTRENSNGLDLCLRKLVAGRVDLVVGDRLSLAWTARQERLETQIRFLPRALAEVPRYVAFPRGREALAERFSAGLDSIRQDGTLDRIIDYWRNPH